MRSASAAWPASKALRTASIWRAGSPGADAEECFTSCVCAAPAGAACSEHVGIARAAANAASAILPARRIASPPQRTSMKKNLKRKLFRWGGSRGISQDQFCWNLIFPAMRFRRCGEFVERVGRHLSEHVAMDVYGGDRRVAVFGEARVVESRDRNIFRNAKARFQQSFQNTDCC